MYSIYIYDDMENFSDFDFERACVVATKERIEKANGYLHSKDRKQSVIAELLLRYALLNKYSIRELPEILFSEYGKPMLQGDNMPWFNISHCDLAVACAVSDHCIGIDVEPYSSYSQDVAQEIFNAAELAYALDAPEHFAELWTKKESYMKYQGQGLVDEIKSLPPHSEGLNYDTFHSTRGYACTVCSSEATVNGPQIVDKVKLFSALIPGTLN